ncbi:uncharacterized protein LOC128875454 [Hylaeus volcanicus]|uniref:uncharacterized protein LOC128875454 n=1 Tax=Hylaeus volcanicus TaxID=313075 RepID=UPI0023B7CA9D|nr:uncharacterized protein LOC128875454 [Hylaeus volcanicus]
MEHSNNEGLDNSSSLLNKDFLQISCNWQINNKLFHDAFTIAASSQKLEKINIDDIVSLDTCILLQPVESKEPCVLDIKLTNRQRISHIAVVSEAYVLEFFKEFGEYEKTVFAEFEDEFEDSFVYIAETAIIPSATEASIKFTKIKSKTLGMWVYGIKLYLTEPDNDSTSFPTDIFNPEIIKNFLTKLNFNTKENDASIDVQSCYKNILNSSKNRSIEESTENEAALGTSTKNETVSDITQLKTYIDNKFHDMEIKVMKSIDEMEQRTNQKLDTILQKLESQFNAK